MVTSLDILMLSETRASWHFFDKLIEAEKDLHSYDYIFLTGGMSNAENVIGQKVKKDHLKQAKTDFDSTLEKLEQLLSKNTKSKLLYVPGASDVHKLFDVSGDDTPKDKKSLNLHKSSYQLADGLVVAGLGGSLPAFL